jgi:hypothetical protein
MRTPAKEVTNAAAVTSFPAPYLPIGPGQIEADDAHHDGADRHQRADSGARG